jgi:uncharacterized protein involved in type VI secretion and phage assembly
MSQINGVVTALVTNVNDPLSEGRIRVRFPWLGDEHETDWIRIASLMSGKGRGTRFTPEVDDEALIAFEHGDPRFPFVVGFMWNGKDEPPNAHVRERRIQSVNGHHISFLDATPSGGSLGALVIEDAHGNRITMSNGKVTISSIGVLEIHAPVVTINGRVVSPTPNPI